MLILGVLSTGAAYVLNYRIITDDGASVASLVTYLVPVTALILGAVILGEPLAAHAIIGMVIVLIGVVLARYRNVSRVTSSWPDDRGPQHQQAYPSEPGRSGKPAEHGHGRTRLRHIERDSRFAAGADVDETQRQIV